MAEPNEPTPVEEFIADWRKLICPTCENPLDLQQRDPPLWFCAACKAWFDGELKRL
jgi:ribosomal protein L37AE/L43A